MPHQLSLADHFVTHAFGRFKKLARFSVAPPTVSRNYWLLHWPRAWQPPFAHRREPLCPISISFMPGMSIGARCEAFIVGLSHIDFYNVPSNEASAAMIVLLDSWPMRNIPTQRYRRTTRTETPGERASYFLLTYNVRPGKLWRACYALATKQCSGKCYHTSAVSGNEYELACKSKHVSHTKQHIV